MLLQYLLLRLCLRLAIPSEKGKTDLQSLLKVGSESGRCRIDAQIWCRIWSVPREIAVCVLKYHPLTL